MDVKELKERAAALPPPSPEAQIAAVKRELRMREGVYPRWVEQGRMPADTAVAQYAALLALLERLEGKLL